MYPGVKLPVCDGPLVDRQVIRTGIAEWVHSTALRDLVAAFRSPADDPRPADPDGGPDNARSLAAELAALDTFSAANWDFRGGAERHQARNPRFAPDTDRLVRDAARALGLIEPTRPRYRRYTHLLILGGLARGCFVRTGFAADLARDIAVDQVAALGGFRPLVAAEHDVLAAEGATDCEYEVDVMDAAVRRHFGVTAPGHIVGTAAPCHHPHRARRVTSYPQRGLTVRVVAAPSSDPEHRRANTADTCRFWADEVAKLTPDDRVLVVTSQMYLPFQHCDAVANIGLEYDCTVDTVGQSTPGAHGTAAYLQEIRSAIRSLRRLHDRLTPST